MVPVVSSSRAPARTMSVTHWGVLDIFDKLDEDFDLFPKSLLQQNQIKSMVIAKAKRKGKKVCPS